MNSNDYSEDIIRKLVRISHPESPSDGFTDNIMNRINAKVQSEEVQVLPGNKLWQRLLLIVMGLALVSATFYYFRHDFAGIFNIDYIVQTFIPYLENLLVKGSDILSQQEFSPVLIVVIITMSFLMILDHYIHSGKRMKSFLFIF